MRPASASAQKPPNTTVNGAPIRAQASIAAGSLGDHRHVNRDTVAAGRTPSSFRALAGGGTSKPGRSA